MYQRQAQGLASLGRGPDTELVHMTPREVGALDTMARRNGLGGLPINPQTGLPEAGIFDSILPMLIGAGAAAAAPFTGGGTLAAFLASPLAMGGTAALGAGIASGFDAAEMAKWGLGIYGGANLAGSLGAAGSAAPAQAEAATAATQEAARQKALAGAQAGVAEAGKTGAVQTQDQIYRELLAKEAKKAAARQAAAQQAGATGLETTYVLDPRTIEGMAAKEFAKQEAQRQAALGAAQSNLAGVSTTPITSPYTGLSPADAGQLYRQTTATGTLGNTLPSSPMFGETAMQAGTDQLKAMGRGITTPSGRQALFGSGIGKDRVAGTLGKAPFITGIGSVAADQYIQSRDAEPFEPIVKDRDIPYPEGGFLPPPRRSIDPFAGELTPTDTGEAVYFDPEVYTSPGYMPARAGGLVSLKGGGLTRGPGDGMSDDIMLPITGSRDIAAVSPDEFVVPADVVSGLGNGSTSAGAKQLYGMMDRVRDARTGKTAQPRAINAGKMMPA